MEEKKALLYKEFSSQGNLQRGKFCAPISNNSSSEDSDEWHEESQSICSSCYDLHSASSFEWEKEIDANGHLFYVESDLTEATDSNSSPNSKEKLENGSLDEKTEKSDNVKKGKLLNWVRRKGNKRLHQNKLPEQQNSIEVPTGRSSGTPVNAKDDGKELRQLVLKVDALSGGETLSEQLLGLSLGFSKENSPIVTNIIPQSPADFIQEISAGDLVHQINEHIVTSQTLQNILQSLHIPCEVSEPEKVFLKIEKTVDSSLNKCKYQSPFVQGLLKRNMDLDAILLDQPVGVVVVDVESQNLNKDDVIYCYPEKCVLSSCRGAFVTLYHLIAEIKSNDVCQSSSVILNNEPTHVMYSSYENYLLLLAVPQSKCSISEATFITTDLIRHLSFSHQTLKKCFETGPKSVLDHFFSVFFYRILCNGFSGDSFEFLSQHETASRMCQTECSHFEEIMPFVAWVPLPKEAQVQIDEALNELEANEFDDEEEDCIENQRLFNILGSALFHKGYLLASHLPKEDLLDVYSLCRQSCIIQLMRHEPVKSLLVWREVFPLSAGRGLVSRRSSTTYVTPAGRWFLLIVAQGYDLLAIILEVGECCAKMEENPGPSVPYVEEAEDTLRHMQKLGISTLASQWIDSNSRFRTVTPEEIFSKLSNRRKDNLLGFVKTLDGSSKPLGAVKVSPTGSKASDLSQGKKSRNLIPETSEDSVSQTPSNVSEVSDENAPILGRKVERIKNSAENLSGDSDSSDSDWDSSRDSNMRESICSSTTENFYLCDVGEILPARLTTGPEDILFYYVHLDGNEGVLMSPPLNRKRLSVKMTELLGNFRRCCQIIHSILENSVKFKNNCQDNSKCLMNKSLVAVKEHGVLFECASSEVDSGKKPISFTYWIVGRLFFAPQPREVYVCYHDEAPQNLVELAFRLGLSSAG